MSIKSAFTQPTWNYSVHKLHTSYTQVERFVIAFKNKTYVNAYGAFFTMILKLKSVVKSNTFVKNYIHIK